MAQHTGRAGLTGSALVRLLAGMGEAPGGAGGPRAAFADGLVQWVGWTDAIALSAALERPATAAGPQARYTDEHAEYERVRATLAQAIGREAQAAGRSPLEAGMGFAPYRQCCVARQQAMGVALAALRERVRAALAACGPDAARLAAVDAVLAQALAVQEQRVFAAVPARLEKHFQRLCADEAAQAGLDAFRADLQAVLLAELELRLQPVEGLLEALRRHTPSGCT
ncbi:MAG TPA: DUF3348 family protein [Alicycliphilus denitrificans]|jgi:hypothetical protein|nr:DUF3348 family protein [Alicycliphilus denitrificans]